MVYYLFIFLFLGNLISNNCSAQIIKTGKGTPISYPNSPKPPKPTPKTFSVSITTNEECSLYVDKKYRSTIKVNEQKNIALQTGTYEIKAVGKKTGNFFNGKLQVKSNNLSYLIDLVAIKREADRIIDSINKWRTDSINAVKQKIKDSIERYENRPDVKVAKELALNMVPINGGTFTMGSNTGENDESPEHAITVGSVLFSKYEVTQQQWEKIMGNNPSEFKGCVTCPVENISWNEISEFLKRLNAATDKKFRLPTEAEWEYAANRKESKSINEIAWYYENSKKRTHTVGELSPNDLGIYDLFGNVAEWCSDWYSRNYYTNSSPNNPSGPANGKNKVTRGGSYNDLEGAFRPTRRAAQGVDAKKEFTGFRLVMEVQ